MEATLMAHCGTEKITRAQLAEIITPESTDTHRPIAHINLVEALIEGLAFRHISVVKDEYAVSEDGMRMFGLLELDNGFDGARFAIGIRNANDKSMRLALTVGFRVFVCDNMSFDGDFTPVLHKHSKNFDLTDSIAIGVDRMQRNFEPMVRTVEAWRESHISDATARLIIYRAFVEGELEAPRHLARQVHDLYFNPRVEAFQPRTTWSLLNAFTSAFKELDPIPQFKATARLGSFFGDAAARPFAFSV
jgi:hypothetical protein